MDRWARLAEPYRGAAREAIARVAARPTSATTCAKVTRVATPARLAS
jgi:aminopeptidase N